MAKTTVVDGAVVVHVVIEMSYNGPIEFVTLDHYLMLLSPAESASTTNPLF
jgi:hypothetical protein